MVVRVRRIGRQRVRNGAGARRGGRRKIASVPAPAPMDSDWSGSILNLVNAANALPQTPENKLLIAQLMGEVRRILRRGDAATEEG